MARPSARFQTQRAQHIEERMQIVNVRLSAELIDRIADFGNAHHLTLSQSIRALLWSGLEEEAQPRS